MTEEKQKQKVRLILRANWLRDYRTDIIDGGEVKDIYGFRPKTKAEKEIRQLEIVRDRLLLDFDIEPAMVIEDKINELLEVENGK